MAAVLCSSCANLCDFTACCKGCGQGCKGCGQACGQICRLPCTLCNSACKACCEGLRNLCTSSFCFYGFVALGLNIPSMINGVLSFPYFGCSGSQWLFLNTLFCASHVAAAIYLANQCVSFSDTTRLLCYDPWMAGYMVLSVISFAWLCSGLTWDLAQGDCPDNINSLTKNSVYFGFSFFFFGGGAMCISALISMCRKDRHQTTNTQTANTQAITTETKQDAYYPPYAVNA